MVTGCYWILYWCSAASPIPPAGLPVVLGVAYRASGSTETGVPPALAALHAEHPGYSLTVKAVPVESAGRQLPLLAGLER